MTSTYFMATLLMERVEGSGQLEFEAMQEKPQPAITLLGRRVLEFGWT